MEKQNNLKEIKAQIDEMEKGLSLIKKQIAALDASVTDNHTQDAVTTTKNNAKKGFVIGEKIVLDYAEYEPRFVVDENNNVSYECTTAKAKRKYPNNKFPSYEETLTSKILKHKLGL